MEYSTTFDLSCEVKFTFVYCGPVSNNLSDLKDLSVGFDPAGSTIFLNNFTIS